MHICGNKIVFEGVEIATIDGGWPTLIKAFEYKLHDEGFDAGYDAGYDSVKGEIESQEAVIADLEIQIANLKHEIANMEYDL